jgi:chemotaxis protein MotB
MGRRRHEEEEHENHERWLVSYADFITLLFAFFVVMYAISMVNEGKYKVLSDALVSAFNNTPGETAGAHVAINPIPGGKLQLPVIKPPANTKAEEVKRQAKDKMRNMAAEIASALGPLVQSGQVRITEGALGITVEINASLLFAPGDARLSVEAVRALSAVALVLTPTDFPIIVEGHTDNTPISTPQFPSNWELSGVRASSVVRLFIDKGVDARRFTVTGYADQRPVADNALIEGRMRNRRVAITIESKVPDIPVDVQVLSKPEG